MRRAGRRRGPRRRPPDRRWTEAPGEGSAPRSPSPEAAPPRSSIHIRDLSFARQLGAPSILGVVMTLLRRKVRKQAKALGVRYEFFFMRASGSQLRELGALYDAGVLRPVIDSTYPFEQTSEAIAYVEQGRTKAGKVVVTMHSAPSRAVGGVTTRRTYRPTSRAPDTCRLRRPSAGPGLTRRRGHRESRAWLAPVPSQVAAVRRSRRGSNTTKARPDALRTPFGSPPGRDWTALIERTSQPQPAR